jgi:transcriptional regulator
LVDKYEQASACPVSVSNFSKATMRQAKGVIGFEIEITQIQATQKMSQNRDDHNYKNIIQELEKTQSPSAIAVAEEMKKIRK